jgi:hypothetical protein
VLDLVQLPQHRLEQADALAEEPTVPGDDPFSETRARWKSADEYGQRDRYRSAPVVGPRRASECAVAASPGVREAKSNPFGRWRKADSTTTANLRYRIDSAIRRASMRLTSSAGRLKATR